MDNGKNIYNAARCLEATYQSIDKMMNKMDEIAPELQEEKRMIVRSAKFLRQRSDQQSHLFFIRDFMKLYQYADRPLINPENEEGYTEGPFLMVQIHLLDTYSLDEMPFIRLAKTSVDFNQSEWKIWKPDMSVTSHYNFNRPFCGNLGYTITSHDNGYFESTARDGISEKNIGIFKSRFIEFPLTDVQNDEDIREKIFQRLVGIVED